MDGGARAKLGSSDVNGRGRSRRELHVAKTGRGRNGGPRLRTLLQLFAVAGITEWDLWWTGDKRWAGRATAISLSLSRETADAMAAKKKV